MGGTIIFALGSPLPRLKKRPYARKSSELFFALSFALEFCQDIGGGIKFFHFAPRITILFSQV